MEHCLNNKECFIPTPEEIKESKGKLKKDELYMNNKKNQSLRMFAHTNAKRRVQRTFLEIFYSEWRALRGLPAVEPYVKSYMGHNTIINLDQVLTADKIKPAKKVKPGSDINAEGDIID